MALPPKFAGQAIVSGGIPQTVHTVELYLDYVCPFSAKMWKTLSDNIFPKLPQKYPAKVKFILRQQIQPWHPSSTLVHEAAAAVLKVAPSKFVEFSTKLFEQQKDFFDVNVVNEVRNDTYSRLAKVAAGVGVAESEILKLLHVSDKPDKDGGLNVGNGTTNDIKLMVRANRLTGVHSTPTVLFNGIEEKSISSSFTADQWDEWLEKNIV